MIGRNNPLNVRRNQIDWQGELPGTGAFADFDTETDGVRAAMLCVLASYRKHGCDTVAKIIARFAPPADHNRTAAYSRFVASRLGVKPDDRINPEYPPILQAFAAAQAWWETHTVLAEDVLTAAADAALAA